MTAINFPDNPQVGDTFLNFAWDGEKWRNAGSRASAVVLKDLFEFSVAADDSTLRTVSTGESIKFTGAGTVTTASDAEGNITITGVGTTSYNDLTDKPTIPSLTGYATETYVTTRGYLTTVGTISYTDLSNKPTLFSGSYTDLTDKPTLVTSYTQLTDKPNLAGTYTFNVAADDSTLREISADETVKFIGANGITTSSDDEGAVTITLGDTLTWTNPSPAPGTPWRTTINAESGNANIVLHSGLPGFGSSVSWTLDETKLTFPDTTEQTTAWTGTAAAGTLTGDTLNSTVVTSSLTSLGTLSGLTVGGTGGDLTMTGGAITGVGNITATGILAVNASGGITTNQTAFDIVNSTATTVNLGGAATAVNIGAITGTLTVNNPTVVGSQTSLTLFNTTATTVSAFGAATTATIGATSGTLSLRNPTVVGTQTTVNLWNTTSSTVNAFGAATTLNIGYTGTTGSNTTNILTAAQQTGTTKTINIGTGSAVGSTTAVNIGSTLGTSTVTINGSLVATLTGNASTATKLATARAINGVDFDGSAAITVTADANTLTGSTLASGVTASSLTSVGTLTGVTSNAATAFIAGSAAESGVALQMPREGALRNLYNGANNNMYFDVSIGGTSQGAFQFRSSSSYTNVLTMSPTGVTFNTDATVTARTPSLARTAFNSAIDTEITVDSMRFRISNQGGIFPQVIGNGSARNLAWTGVGAISGYAVTQLGSTGNIVADNAWTTLFNGHGMDSAGDTVTVTLQDKAAGRIYRITFMRSDNGSTTGYNIIAERLL